MSLRDEAGQQAADLALEKALQRVAQLEVLAEAHKRKYEAMRRNNVALQTKINEQQKLVEVLTLVDEIQAHPPEWTREPLVTHTHVGTPVLLITDTHYGEVVRPEEIHHINAYNNKIAEMRTMKAFQGAVKVAKDYLSGTYAKYDGIVVAFGGDIVTGTIHEELAHTNEDPVPVTVDMAIDWLVAGLQLLHEEFGKVHVVGVVGNHDRLGKKVPSKRRAQESWTWLIYKTLAREFKHVDSVTFDIPEGAEALVNVYDTSFLLLHGNDDRGGHGISGAMAPVLRGAHKRSRRQLIAAKSTKDMSKAADFMLMGHWHQRIITTDVIIGNTLKGFDEYARGQGFAPSEPSQELMIVTPERGITFSTPVLCMDREAEGW